MIVFGNLMQFANTAFVWHIDTQLALISYHSVLVIVCFHDAIVILLCMFGLSLCAVLFSTESSALSMYIMLICDPLSKTSIFRTSAGGYLMVYKIC